MKGCICLYQFPQFLIKGLSFWPISTYQLYNSGEMGVVGFFSLLCSAVRPDTMVDFVAFAVQTS